MLRVISKQRAEAQHLREQIHKSQELLGSQMLHGHELADDCVQSVQDISQAWAKIGSLNEFRQQV
jgi:hypothetical protein